MNSCSSFHLKGEVGEYNPMSSLLLVVDWDVFF